MTKTGSNEVETAIRELLEKYRAAEERVKELESSLKQIAETGTRYGFLTLGDSAAEHFCNGWSKCVSIARAAMLKSDKGDE